MNKNTIIVVISLIATIALPIAVSIFLIAGNIFNPIKGLNSLKERITFIPISESKFEKAPILLDVIYIY